MKYLCLAYGSPAAMEHMTPAQQAELFERCQAFDAEMRATGGYLESYSLDWDAATVRPQGGRPLVSDGPFVESREIVGGLVVIEAADLNEAIRIASLHPAANLGEEYGWAVEVRPITVCKLAQAAATV